MVRVLIGGKFDPIHQGHLHYIHRAYTRGDWLYIVTFPDNVVARNSKSGKCAIPLYARVEMLQGILFGLGGKGCVVPDILDEDGSAFRMLHFLRPDVYFKNGDRSLNNIPENEKVMCTNIGCEIVYEEGGNFPISSTEIKSET